MLNFALEISAASGGAYDPGAGAMVKRWGFGAHGRCNDPAFAKPSAQEVQTLLYVQERLLGNADEVLLWLEQGAALHVCGSLAGMARGVDQALEHILGRAGLEALAAQERYRRDVY